MTAKNKIMAWFGALPLGEKAGVLALALIFGGVFLFAASIEVGAAFHDILHTH